MSGNEGIRIVSLFVGVLLCTALIQTACAAWNVPNWNANIGNVTVNTGNIPVNIGNVPVWTTNENRTAENTSTWNSTDGSLPPSGLTNTSIPSSNFVNFPKFSDLVNGSTSLNGAQFPGIQWR